MSENKDQEKILLDSDVIRHFIKGDRLLYLPKIFPNRLIIVDIVKDELCRSHSIATTVNNFISFTKVELMTFPSDITIKKEFARLIKMGFGEGESACMAVARFNKQIIASSNLKDIKVYCKENSIKYITTMDVLVEALENKIMDETECDYFIYNVKLKGSKLPCDTIKEYVNKFKSKQ